ncbi:hypothetical protein ACOSQ2_027280 [Xanthoceras sorbifolium]
MSRKSQEEVTTEYWSKLSSQSSPSMKKDTNKEGPHNKEENEVEDLVEEWLLHQNTEIRSRWRIHCRCFPGISQATRNQTSLKGRIEQSLTWPEALTSNHTIPPTGFGNRCSSDAEQAYCLLYWHTVIKQSPFDVIYGRPPPTLFHNCPFSTSLKKEWFQLHKLL